jgi:hypothetical protein
MRSRGRYGYLRLGDNAVYLNVRSEQTHKVSLVPLPSGTYAVRCRKAGCGYRHEDVGSLGEAESLARRHLHAAGA